MNLRFGHTLALLHIAFTLMILASCGSALSANAPPYITGTPAAGVLAGQEYVFRPSAGDPENQKLTFSIVNKPVWANFSPISGGLTGTTTVAQAGNYPGIVIGVSDGTHTVRLPSF